MRVKLPQLKYILPFLHQETITAIFQYLTGWGKRRGVSIMWTYCVSSSLVLCCNG